MPLVLRPDLARNNAQFMERIVHLAREYGRALASPTEAGLILNIGKIQLSS